MLNSGKHRWFFLSRVTLNFYKWPWKTTGHLFHATPSFVRHFIAMHEFKLEVQSGNTKFGSELAFFLSCVTLKFDGWHEKQWGTFPMPHQALCITSSIYVNSNWSYGPEMTKLGFDLCDHDLWPWPVVWTSLLSVILTPENFMMIQWQEHCEKGVTDVRTDRWMDRWTEVFLELLDNS